MFQSTRSAGFLPSGIMTRTAPEEMVQEAAQGERSVPLRRLSMNKTWTQLFTVATPDDKNWMGARPSEKDQDIIDRIMKGELPPGVSQAHGKLTEGARFRQVLLDFPKHVMHMFMGLFIPLLTGTAVLFWSGFVARRLADRFPNAYGQIDVLEEDTVNVRGARSSARCALCMQVWSHFVACVSRCGRRPTSSSASLESCTGA
jgi:hypothetical protein